MSEITFTYRERIGVRADSPMLTVKLTPSGQFRVFQSGTSGGKAWSTELHARSVDSIRTALRARLPQGMPTMRVNVEDDVYGLNHAGIADLIAAAWSACVKMCKPQEPV